MMPVIMPLPTPTPACACRRPVFKNSNPVVRTRRCLPTLSPKKSGMAARELRHLHGARHEDEVVDKKLRPRSALDEDQHPVKTRAELLQSLPSGSSRTRRPHTALDEQDTQSRPEPNSRNLFLRAHQEHGGGARAVLLMRTNTQSRPEPNSRNLFLRAHQEHALPGPSSSEDRHVHRDADVREPATG
jgi:hypothetical protein